MKKQYPPAVMMRKRLIFIAMTALSLIIALIIYNLWGDSPRADSVSKSAAVIPDTATSTDTAWFQEAKISSDPAALTLEEKKLTHPLPLALIKSPVLSEMDDRAMQAPIASNQILSESVEKPVPVSAALPVMPSSPPSDLGSAAEKKDFLKAAQNESADYLRQSLQNPVSAYELKMGTIIPATLISGINSDLPGPITAQVRENVYDTVAGRYLLIPQGAKLQGIYDSSVVYGQQRVLIVWQRLIFPNGQSLRLAGMPGVDVSGYAGFRDQVNNHYSRLLGSSALLSLISAGLQLSQPRQPDNTNSPSVNQTLAQNLGISLSQTSETLLQKNMNIQPTLEIRPGYLFNVSITQDVVFPAPYYKNVKESRSPLESGTI